MVPVTTSFLAQSDRSGGLGERGVDLAKRWNKDGLLSDKGLRAVLDVER